MAAEMESGDFVEPLGVLQKQCGVAELKMSDFGIKESELEAFAVNARGTMGFLYDFDPVPLSDDDALKIMKACYK